MARRHPFLDEILDHRLLESLGRHRIGQMRGDADHPLAIAHHDVAGVEQRRQVAHAKIRQPLRADRQQPGGVTRAGGGLGDQPLGQGEVEIRRAQRRRGKGIGHGGAVARRPGDGNRIGV